MVKSITIYLPGSKGEQLSFTVGKVVPSMPKDAAGKQWKAKTISVSTSGRIQVTGENGAILSYFGMPCSSVEE